MGQNDPHVHSGNLSKMYDERTDEYYTPERVVRPLAESVDGFDLDPCSGTEFARIADTVYTEDGLEKDWYGDVWLNPPYSDIGPWLDKANQGVEEGDIMSVFALVPYRTQTQWFQRNVDNVNVICFVEGCISFGDSDDTAPFGNLILGYGNIRSESISALNEMGQTVSGQMIGGY